MSMRMSSDGTGGAGVLARGRLVAGFPRLAGLALLAGSCLAACGGLAPLEPDPGLEPSSSDAAWLDQAASWDKLEAIETWLVGPGPDERPELVPEAELQLAEGRLQLARQDQDTLPAAGLRVRVAAAENGFRRVLASPESSPLQVRRARQGLAEAGELHGAGAAASSIAGLQLLPRSAWRASAPVTSRLTPARGRYERITVHHSTIPTRDLGSMSQAETGEAVQGIQRVHMLEERYGDIGYHFLIDPRGRVFEGRALRFQGAHSGGTNGANNVGNIGICLLGNFEQELPSGPALAALQRLVDGLCKEHRIARGRVYGHQELKATACPGRHLMGWVERYRASLAAR